MKSSKMENIFNFNPPVEEGQTLPPFAYYQPIRSGFDPMNAGKTPGRGVAPPQMKRWGQGVRERSVGSVHVSGGGILNPSECETEGFGPRTFPGGSTSVWGETEGRSICNSTWRTSAPPRPSFSGVEEGQGSKHSIPGTQFSPKGEMGFGGLCPPGLGGLGALDGASFRVGTSLCHSTGQVTPSTYYLGRNTSQNLYKTGHSRPMMCNFCKNNKEVPDIYLNHYLYDPTTKVLSCPVLRKHVCEVCGGTGDQAHTLQYCPVNRERGLQSKFPVLLKTRTITNSTGKIRRN